MKTAFVLKLKYFPQEAGQEANSSDAQEVINDSWRENLLNMILFTQAVKQQSECLEFENLPRDHNKVNISKGKTFRKG